MTDDELQAIRARAITPKWPELPETLRDTAGVLSRFVRKKGDQNVIDHLQAAADEVEALRRDSTALVAEVERLKALCDQRQRTYDACVAERDALESEYWRRLLNRMTQADTNPNI